MATTHSKINKCDYLILVRNSNLAPNQMKAFFYMKKKSFLIKSDIVSSDSTATGTPAFAPVTPSELIKIK